MSQLLVKWLIYMREFRRMRHIHSNTRAQRGNVLFLILLGVVLFAALNYAVTNSMRGEGKDSSNERAATIAAQIINVVGLQEPELIRFMARTGLGIHQIDFIGSRGTAYVSGNSPNCTATSCDFWNAAGGNVTPPILPQEAHNPAATGACALGGEYRPSELNGAIRPYTMVVSATGVGTTASDVALYYDCILPQICSEINIQEGLRQRSETPITAAPNGTYASNYSDLQSSTPSGLANTTANRTAASDSRLVSRRVWCGESGRLYAVIYAR